jgi:hypothetical protein
MMRCRPFIVAAVAALSLLAAGCGGGGSGSPGVASVASSTTTATTASPDDLLAFSQCMRRNGVPNFPDPQHYAGGNAKLTIHNLNPPQSAMNACGHLLPNGGSQQTAQQLRVQLADELSFAKCMRSHGVARFPDPTAQGQLSVAMVQAQGIDVHSPVFLRVVQTCLPASHGGLTAAKVREAIANAGH